MFDFPSKRSRCVISACIYHVRHVVFHGRIPKRKEEGGEGRERRREGRRKARGDKGELSWENGGATRLAAILFRVAKTGFRSSCILLVILASCFLVRVIVNRENLYFLPPNKFHNTVRDIYIYNGFWYLDEGFFFLG